MAGEFAAEAGSGDVEDEAGRGGAVDGGRGGIGGGTGGRSSAGAGGTLGSSGAAGSAGKASAGGTGGATSAGGSAGKAGSGGAGGTAGGGGTVIGNGDGNGGKAGNGGTSGSAGSAGGVTLFTPASSNCAAGNIDALFNVCRNCHSARSADPPPLVTYAQIFEMKSDIAFKLTGNEMPPPGSGYSINSNSKAAIVAWINAGTGAVGVPYANGICPP